MIADIPWRKRFDGEWSAITQKEGLLEGDTNWEKIGACVFFLPAEKMGLKLDYTGKLGWYAT